VAYVIKKIAKTAVVVVMKLEDVMEKQRDWSGN